MILLQTKRFVLVNVTKLLKLVDILNLSTKSVKNKKMEKKHNTYTQHEFSKMKSLLIDHDRPMIFSDC